MHDLLPGSILICGMISVDLLMHAPSVARSELHGKELEFVTNTTNYVHVVPLFFFLRKV
jgi:hypothetical protein